MWVVVQYVYTIQPTNYKNARLLDWKKVSKKWKIDFQKIKNQKDRIKIGKLSDTLCNALCEVIDVMPCVEMRQTLVDALSCVRMIGLRINSARVTPRYCHCTKVHVLAINTTYIHGPATGPIIRADDRSANKLRVCYSPILSLHQSTCPCDKHHLHPRNWHTSKVHYSSITTQPPAIPTTHHKIYSQCNIHMWQPPTII